MLSHFMFSKTSAFFLHQALKLVENNIFNGINIMLLLRCLMTSFQIPKEGTLDALLKSEILFFIISSKTGHLIKKKIKASFFVLFQIRNEIHVAG